VEGARACYLEAQHACAQSEGGRGSTRVAPPAGALGGAEVGHVIVRLTALLEKLKVEVELLGARAELGHVVLEQTPPREHLAKLALLVDLLPRVLQHDHRPRLDGHQLHA